MKLLLLLSALCMLLPLPYGEHTLAGEIEFNGQASVWAIAHDEWQTGMRYIPELRFSHPLAEGKDMDAEISLNAYAWTPIDSSEWFDPNADADLDLYRMWLRYATAQFEMRIGLQKINFGPAKILRSLMWFDQVDVRDPLELTDGVYALLTRYYFLNNANIWVWGLYGNDDPKGVERFRTDTDRMELGGRCQVPVPRGEMAFSYHHRYVDQADWERLNPSPLSDGEENRYAFDGNLDAVVGLWFEASAGEIKINADESLWQEFLTLGTDYTFDMGPGIHWVFEHLIKRSGPKIDRQSNISKVSALSVDFSIGILDTINAIGYCDWKEEKTFAFLGWQRVYDQWMFHVSLFSGPRSEEGQYRGDGGQLMLTYNH